MIHQLKCESRFFEDTASGIKNFEVRLNDRDFKAGDFLALNEITEHPGNDKGEHLETGCCCLVEAVYVLTDERFVKPGYAIIGHRPCAIGTQSGENVMYDYDRMYKVPVYDIASCKKPEEK